MPMFFEGLTYIEEGIGRIGSLVSDSDGSIIADIRNQTSIKHVVSICNLNKNGMLPLPEEVAKVYCQTVCFLQVISPAVASMFFTFRVV